MVYLLLREYLVPFWEDQDLFSSLFTLILVCQHELHKLFGRMWRYISQCWISSFANPSPLKMNRSAFWLFLTKAIIDVKNKALTRQIRSRMHSVHLQSQKKMQNTERPAQTPWHWHCVYPAWKTPGFCCNGLLCYWLPGREQPEGQWRYCVYMTQPAPPPLSNKKNLSWLLQTKRTTEL